MTRDSRVVEFVHLDLAGVPRVEEGTVVSNRLQQIQCRWCLAVDAVELVPRPGVDSVGDAGGPR